MDNRKYLSISMLIIFLGVILSGCATKAPVSYQNFDTIVRDILQLENEDIVFAHSFEWLPETYGYEKTMKWKIDRDYYKGIFTCTERSLYFLALIGDQYIPRLKMDYAEIISVDLKKHGLGRRLIIQNEDYDTHTFQALTASGFSVDKKKTEAAYQIIKEKTKK